MTFTVKVCSDLLNIQCMTCCMLNLPLFSCWCNIDEFSKFWHLVHLLEVEGLNEAVGSSNNFIWSMYVVIILNMFNRMILLSYAFSDWYVIVCLSYFVAASNKFIYIVLPSDTLIKFHDGLNWCLARATLVVHLCLKMKCNLELRFCVLANKFGWRVSICNMMGAVNALECFN